MTGLSDELLERALDVYKRQESWEPQDCPLCKAGAGEPVKPGSRKV